MNKENYLIERHWASVTFESLLLNRADDAKQDGFFLVLDDAARVMRGRAVVAVVWMAIAIPLFLIVGAVISAVASESLRRSEARDLLEFIGWVQVAAVLVVGLRIICCLSRRVRMIVAPREELLMAEQIIRKNIGHPISAPSQDAA